MRIGIDATPLPPEPVGAGTYIIQLVRALVHSPSEHLFVVFAQEAGRRLIGDLPGVEWVIDPDRSPAVRLIWEQIRLPVLVRQRRLDLLHSLHYTRPYFLPCASVVTFHDMTFFLFPELHTRLKRSFFPPAIRLSARRANALIAISESTRQDAIRLLKISPQQITAIPLGIGPSFRPIQEAALLQSGAERYNLPQEFILFVGLIEPRKNLPLLLRAYSRLAEQPDCLPLVLVGRLGWMFEEVHQLIQNLDLGEKVIFTGYIPGGDLPIVYNLATIFVYPSSYEGFGFPPLEAMACGTPVITTAISAMQETVGNAGILIPLRDEPALVEAMRSLISSPALRKRLSDAGRLRASAFSWQRTASETLKVYEQIGRSLGRT